MDIDLGVTVNAKRRGSIRGKGSDWRIAALKNALEEARKQTAIADERRRDAEEKLAIMRRTVQELEDRLRAMRFRAEHEPITKLLRKEVVEQEVRQYLLSLDADECKRTCLLYLDIDDFKKFNDRYGHKEGDVVLERVGEATSATIRRGDFAGRGDAGDEIIVFLRDTTPEEARLIGERICQVVERREYSALTLGGERSTYHISISFGAAMYDERLSFYEWKDLADRNMYLNKRKKKSS